MYRDLLRRGDPRGWTTARRCLTARSASTAARASGIARGKSRRAWTNVAFCAAPGLHTRRKLLKTEVLICDRSLRSRLHSAVISFPPSAGLRARRRTRHSSRPARPPACNSRCTRRSGCTSRGRTPARRHRPRGSPRRSKSRYITARRRPSTARDCGTHVIREIGRRLDLAAHEQRVLVRNQELAVVLDSRPAGSFHQRVVQRPGAFQTTRANVVNLLCAQTPVIEIFHRTRRLFLAVREAYGAGREPGQRHAHEAAQDAALESVARPLGDDRLFFEPTRSSAASIARLQVFFRQRQALAPHSCTASASSLPVSQASLTPDPVSTLVEPEPSPMRA